MKSTWFVAAIFIAVVHLIGPAFNSVRSKQTGGAEVSAAEVDAAWNAYRKLYIGFPDRQRPGERQAFVAGWLAARSVCVDCGEPATFCDLHDCPPMLGL